MAVKVLGNTMFVAGSCNDTLFLPDLNKKVFPQHSFLASVNLKNGTIRWLEDFPKQSITTMASSDTLLFISGFIDSVFKIRSLSVSSSNKWGGVFIGCISENGNPKWLNSVDGPCGAYAHDVAADATGNCYLLGDRPYYCGPFAPFATHTFLKKYDPTGKEIADHHLDSTIFSPKINCGPDGSVYLSGFITDKFSFTDANTTYTLSGQHSSFLIKTDKSFSTKYIKHFTGLNGGTAVASKGAIDHNHNFYVMVNTDGVGISCDKKNYLPNSLLKLDSSGNVVKNYANPLDSGTQHQLRILNGNTILQSSYIQRKTIFTKFNTQTLAPLSTVTISQNKYLYPDQAPLEMRFDVDKNDELYIGGQCSSYDSLEFIGSDFIISPHELDINHGFIAAYGTIDFTGVRENMAGQEIEIFPNPAHDKIYIQHGKTISRAAVYIYDILGTKREARINYLSGKIEIEVTGIDPGVYILQIETSEGLIGRRIIIE